MFVTKENVLRYHYGITLKKGLSKEELMQRLLILEGVQHPKISSNEIEQA